MNNIMISKIKGTGAYYSTGLETQMIEVRGRGEQVIRRDVLIKQHGLNEPQAKALGFLIQHGKLTIQDFELLCPEANRRSLQRDLKGMMDKQLIRAQGATNPSITLRADLGMNLRQTCVQTCDKLTT